MGSTATPLIQIYAPDGTLGEVPYERLHDALQAGGKMAVHMAAPDGTQGYIPADKTQDAVKAGGKIIPFDVAGPQPEQEGFLKAAGGTLSGLLHPAAQNPYPGMDLEAKQAAARDSANADAARKAAGYSPLYRVAAPVAQSVGADVPGMEQAAAAGDTSGVLGHAAGSAAPAVAALGLNLAGSSPEAVTPASRLRAQLEHAHEISGQPPLPKDIPPPGLIPSTKRAGAALQDIRQTAGDVPIDMAKPGDVALQIYEQSQRGATLPSAVRKLIVRAVAKDGPPITYAEAKDFQSNISSLSASDRMALNPKMARLVGQLNGALKDSLESAADTQGKGEQFAQAMKEYHNAMTLQEWTDTIKKNAWKAALTGVAGYELKRLLGL